MRKTEANNSEGRREYQVTRKEGLKEDIIEEGWYDGDGERNSDGNADRVKMASNAIKSI